MSSIGVATGSMIVLAQFNLPASIEGGDSTLEVIANAIPSRPVYVTVGSEEAKE